MALDLCYICDVPQGPGSGGRLLVARSTSASASSVKDVQSLLCNFIISDDPIGHSEFWVWDFTMPGMYRHSFHTILWMAEAILRKSAGYKTTQSITMSLADEGMHYLYSHPVMFHVFIPSCEEESHSSEELHGKSKYHFGKDGTHRLGCTGGRQEQH